MAVVAQQSKVPLVYLVPILYLLQSPLLVAVVAVVVLLVLPLQVLLVALVVAVSLITLAELVVLEHLVKVTLAEITEGLVSMELAVAVVQNLVGLALALVAFIHSY